MKQEPKKPDALAGEEVGGGRGGGEAYFPKIWLGGCGELAS